MKDTEDFADQFHIAGPQLSRSTSFLLVAEAK
jgi:hypothetical protein